MQIKIIKLFTFLSLFSCFGTTSKRVSIDEFDKIVKQGNIKIVDLRTPKEVQSTGVVSGAEVKNYFDSDFDEYVKGLDKSRKYIIYCKSGGRSSRAVKSFLSAGLKVYELGAGISGWQEKGRPLVKN